MTRFDIQQSMALACLLLAGAAYTAQAHAGTANGAFSVKVTAVEANNSSCITAYALGTGLLVRCTSGIFFNISQVSTAWGGVPLMGRSIGVFQSPAEKRTASSGDEALFDDAVADAERGWSFADQLHSVAPDAAPKTGKTLAQLKQRNREGTLAALQVSQTIGGTEAFEMLITF